MTPQEFADYLTDGFGDYDDELNGWIDARVDDAVITFTVMTLNAGTDPSPSDRFRVTVERVEP